MIDGMKTYKGTSKLTRVRSGLNNSQTHKHKVNEKDKHPLTNNRIRRNKIEYNSLIVNELNQLIKR